MNRDEEIKLHLYSDGILLEEAIRFATDISDKILPNSQINGLLFFSRSGWNDLERYVSHQASRNWPEGYGGSDHPTKAFYLQMKQKLDWLRKQAQDSGLVPEGLTKAETRDRTSVVSARLAQEFIQHLAAEMLYRQKG